MGQSMACVRGGEAQLLQHGLTPFPRRRSRHLQGRVGVYKDNNDIDLKSKGSQGLRERVKKMSFLARPLLYFSRSAREVGSDVFDLSTLGRRRALCTFTSAQRSHRHPFSPIVFPSSRMFSLSFPSPLHLVSES